MDSLSPLNKFLGFACFFRSGFQCWKHLMDLKSCLDFILLPFLNILIMSICFIFSFYFFCVLLQTEELLLLVRPCQNRRVVFKENPINDGTEGRRCLLASSSSSPYPPSHTDLACGSLDSAVLSSNCSCVQTVFRDIWRVRTKTEKFPPLNRCRISTETHILGCWNCGAKQRHNVELSSFCFLLSDEWQASDEDWQFTRVFLKAFNQMCSSTDSCLQVSARNVSFIAPRCLQQVHGRESRMETGNLCSKGAKTRTRWCLLRILQWPYWSWRFGDVQFSFGHWFQENITRRSCGQSRENSAQRPELSQNNVSNFCSVQNRFNTAPNQLCTSAVWSVER